ncbi:MAG: type II toxin-antitoxin system HicB family antitoxin [Chloroflexi bacterium]|nr:type II toxin-antitoxin system HicB family antitoxin [Chloroflexota bacterium]
MTYYAILENGKKASFQASIIGFPDIIAKGSTRQEALANLQRAMSLRLSQVEIVPIELEATQAEHPWQKFAGIWADEPHFDEFLEDIKQYRHELDASDNSQVEESS